MNAATEMKRQDKEITTGDYVAAELNLESIGYFSAGYKRKYPTEVQRSKVVTLNRERRIEIIPNLKYGFPNSEDQDFYRAFLKICDERVILTTRKKEGQASLHPRLQLPLGFYSREIIRKAGRAWSNRDLQSVREWIKRSTSTIIEGELYRAKTKEFSRFGGPLFSQHLLVGERMRGGKLADMNFVWPAPWFLSNFYYRYVRPIDLAFHQRLRKPIAKTLYPILDTGWYAADGGDYAKRYEDLCTLFFIPAHQHLSLAKQQLDPSHEELHKEHFLAAWEYSLDQDGEWSGVIRWWPGAKWFQDQEARLSRKELVERYGSITMLPAPEEPEAKKISGVVQSSISYVAVGADSAEVGRIRKFYTALGQEKISRQKVGAGVKLLGELQEQGFSLDDIDVGLEWIVQNKEKFGGAVYSVRLLPEVIGQALTAKGQDKKREVRTQQKRLEEQQREEEERKRERLAAIYELLPTDKQEAMRVAARESLLHQGLKEKFLLEPIIRSEVFRLVAEDAEEVQGEGALITMRQQQPRGRDLFIRRDESKPLR